MNANEIADELDKYKGIATRDAATMLRQQQAKLEKSQELLREYTALNMRQQAEIEALKQIIDANNLSQNIGQFVKPDLKIKEVMSENCTCYKLGYSQLNDYASVKQK